MTQTFKIAVIPGDGIGREVIPAGVAALESAARGSGVTLAFSDFPWGCEFYKQTGRMMDADGFEQLARFDAIYLGAIGAPGVPDGISAALILAVRQRFQQYVNLRPMRLLPGLASPRTPRASTRASAVGSTSAPSARSRSRSVCSRGTASSGSSATRSIWPRHVRERWSRARRSRTR
jgi:Isocitrate/isopropylmalate dehydrogenase